MHYVIGVLIIAMANRSFTLIPWYHVKGVFNVVDLGNLLLWVALALVMAKSRRLGELRNPITLFVLGYLMMVLIHVTNATINYDQGIKDSLIRSRHQFYYLAYFYFFLAFDTSEKMLRFLNVLTGVAIALILLSVVNYFWPVVFHHEQYGEGHGERGGIKRAYIPGMDIIGLAFLWQLTLFLHAKTDKGKAALRGIFLFAGLLFRQTRGRIIAATLVAAWMLVRAKRIKLMLATLLAVGIFGVAIQFILPENLLLESYSSAYSDIKHEEGTWRGRAKQIADSWDTFMEHPYIGSGALFIRRTEDAIVNQDIAADAYQSDLGWPHWIKDYGILGMVWIIGLMLVIFVKKRMVLKVDGDNLLAAFAWYQWLHLLVGMATIGYFFRTHGITIVCLVLAILARTLFVANKAQEVSEELRPAPPEADRILRRANQNG